MSGGTLTISVLEHLPFDRLRANGLIQRFLRTFSFYGLFGYDTCPENNAFELCETV